MKPCKSTTDLFGGQLSMFKPCPGDLVCVDGIAHWTHRLQSEKSHPHLRNWYRQMIEWNKLRMDVGFDMAGPMPRHPYDEGDDE